MTGDDEIEALLRKLGKRPAPPAAVTAAVYESARRAWALQVRRRRWVRGLYAAAAAVCLAFIGVLGIEMRSPRLALATISAGEPLSIDRPIWHVLAPGPRSQIFEGDVVRTGAAGLSVRRLDGAELRIAQNSTLSFTETDALQLASGHIFVDTHAESGPKTLRVITQFGTVDHVGTQFQVANDGLTMWVAVRQGQVALRAVHASAHQVMGGQAAALDAEGHWRQWDLGALDPRWDWADRLASPVEIEGQSLYAVLSRIAERSGIELTYTSAKAESDARALILHGAALRLPPREAFSAVLATSSLKGSVGDGQFLVTARH